MAKEYIQNDSVEFQIGIRNKTYRSLVAEKALYIEYLKSQIQDKSSRNHDEKHSHDRMSEG